MNGQSPPLEPATVRGADWLRAALARAQSRVHDPSGELAASVRVYVRHLRKDGVSPERALVHLKQLLQDSFVDLSIGAPERELAERIVTEAIAAYYAEP